MKSLILLAATMMLALSAQAQQFGMDRGGFDRDGRGGWDRDGGRGNDWDRGGNDWNRPGRPGPGGPGWGREETITVRCESQNGRDASCNAGGDIVRIFVGQQLSKSSCIEGQSFGATGSIVWVKMGCRADFNVTIRRNGGGGPGRPGPGPGPRQPDEYVRCESRNYRYAECRVRGSIDQVVMSRRVSSSSCDINYSYGVRYSDNVIWVDKGCAADFAVYYRRW